MRVTRVKCQIFLMTLFLLALQWAVVQASSAFMHSRPDYESSVDSQTMMGTVVEILDTDRYWTRIRTPEPYEGWTNELCLVRMTEQEKDEWIASPRYFCDIEYTHIFESPSDNSSRLCDFTMGNIVRKGVRSTRQWVEVILPNGRPGWVRKSEVRDFGEWNSDIVGTARLFVGTPYMWGGRSAKHFDCSGLTGFCYFCAGILLPRDASEQIRCGEEVAIEDMQAGDLVFFGEDHVSHVALCTGPGKIIHSSQVVRENSLDPSAPDCYGRHILAVRRILGHVDDGTGAVSVEKCPLYFVQR